MKMMTEYKVDVNENMSKILKKLKKTNRVYLATYVSNFFFL